MAVADVIATEAGTLRFFAHASESGFTNTFHINDTLGNPYSYTEVGAVTGWDDPLVPFAEFDVPLNTTFSSLLARFTTNGTPPASTPGVDANIGEIGFGIFVASNGDYDPFHLYFAYDDNGAGPDDNHDDLIVSVQLRARFQYGHRSGSGADKLCGLGSVGRRRRLYCRPFPDADKSNRFKIELAGGLRLAP